MLFLSGGRSRPPICRPLHVYVGVVVRNVVSPAALTKEAGLLKESGFDNIYYELYKLEPSDLPYNRSPLNLFSQPLCSDALEHFSIPRTEKLVYWCFFTTR